MTISLTPNRLGPPGRAVSAPSNDESVAVADVIQRDVRAGPGTRVEAKRDDASHNAGGTDSGIGVLSDAERRAAEWALSLGGTVEILQDTTIQRVNSTGELPSGPFLVTAIVLIRCQSPVDLARLQGMTRLQRLHLVDSRIERGSLQYIESLYTLGELNLHRVNITDADLRHIECLSNLYYVNLSFTSIGDEGVGRLKQLSKLTYLIWLAQT